MAINNAQLDRLNKDYLNLKGTRVSYFVCPVTLLDEPAELCNGHILNGAIKKASRAKIIQRKDIDNYFGKTIEPDLVEWLNLPTLSRDQLFRKSHTIHVTIPSGDRIEAFYSSRRKAGKKYPQINLFNQNGSVVSSPFLKTNNPELMEFKDAEVEGNIRLNNTAFLGSLIKSAYLTLFRMFGYAWVFGPAGDKIRRALAKFYQDKGGKDPNIDYFADFRNAVSVELSNIFGDEDTLERGSFLLHYTQRSASTEILFALSCLFRINDRTIIVTLPSFQTMAFDFSIYRDYQLFLQDHSMPHNAYFARFVNNRIERDVKPQRIIGAK